MISASTGSSASSSRGTQGTAEGRQRSVSDGPELSAVLTPAANQAGDTPNPATLNVSRRMHCSDIYRRGDTPSNGGVPPFSPLRRSMFRVAPSAHVGARANKKVDRHSRSTFLAPPRGFGFHSRPSWPLATARLRLLSAHPCASSSPARTEAYGSNPRGGYRKRKGRPEGRPFLLLPRADLNHGPSG